MLALTRSLRFIYPKAQGIINTVIDFGLNSDSKGFQSSWSLSGIVASGGSETLR